MKVAQNLPKYILVLEFLKLNEILEIENIFVTVLHTTNLHTTEASTTEISHSAQTKVDGETFTPLI